ncbi:hypothetical protein ACTXJX_17445 [Glutamicibacter ardleyensis]|uniref:hypothetical protein n=1 Tax=Glutamicibacter ardleyensis TaxID=225894 RepID=UPI003FD4E4A8
MDARIMIFQQSARPVLTDVLTAGITGASLSYVQQIINHRELAPAYARWKETGFNLQFGRIPEAQYDKLSQYASAKLGGIRSWYGSEKLCLIPEEMGEALAKKFKKTYELEPIGNLVDESSQDKKAGVKGAGHPTLVFPDDDSPVEKRIQVGVKALNTWFDSLSRAEQVRWYDANMPMAFMILPVEHCLVEPMTALSDADTMQVEQVDGVKRSSCAVITKTKETGAVGHVVDWWSNESNL